MGIRSLTRTEAERRAALLTVDRYDVEIDLTALPDGPDIRCVSTVTFTCGEPGAETFVDCASQVRSATLNGTALTPTGDGRIPLPALAERNVLRVESIQADTATGQGVHKATDPADGEVYVWMSFEPDEARFVWACFDQPDLKAPHAFTVTAPPAWTVTSNSGDARVEELGSARRWTFPDTPPLSTYNTVVNAGPFHEIRRETDGHDLGLYARRSLAPILDRDADEIFTLTRQGLAFFGEAFVMPFPQRKYDQVFVPEFGGAMENYGCVTWSDAFLRRATPTPAESELLAKVLLHEMAHMWFGNIVTMRWWDDLWLNEAFAEFACHWAAERATRYTDAWAGHLVGDKLTAYLSDQGPVSHPIHQPIHDVAQAASIFDNITYPKGASVLQQLMTYVGEERFRAGMTAYFARHAWGNTTLQDLIDALSESGGRDLDAWRTAWLETAGTDRFSLERDGETVTLVAADTPRPQVLAVGAYGGNGEALERRTLVRVEVTQTRTPITGLPPEADVLLINDDDLTFATTRPDPTTRDALFRTAAQLPTAISRGVAAATVWDMLTTGEATAAEAGRCLTAVLAAETSDAVIEPYLTLAANIAELWASPGERADLTAAVATTCRRLATNPGRRQVALRGLARTATNADDLTWLREQAGDDVDLHWRALVREAELGGDVSSEAALLLERDPDPDAWIRALTVRAAIPDPATKAEVWQKLAVDRAVPVSSVAQVATAFWRPAQDALLTPYTQRYLDSIPHLHEGGMIPAMVYTGRLFPPHAIDSTYIEKAQQASQDAAPVVRNTLLERSDAVSRMLRARST
ncbi:aminopeptidase N [Streptomyces sp. NL15-2K]|uniref:aminopeptidase N n=1 Tax=Streptomyces sp. NL15-2K TaxID=376149 RepID=UPI000F55E55A|nr:MULTISPECIES: aminopeptidase N [Actinomycetes]WKX12542.1 aminopeptidase N [Kutzneria buriramensis]GCB52106.1 membrane alanine aminopeptidase N [Streptomyces sp. NL15-2K]